MPITQFLGNSKFDPEIRRIMGVAFEMARVALNVADRGDLANEVIAKRIIELAKAGELNPERIPPTLRPLARLAQNEEARKSRWRPDCVAGM
jgi:hypothetical protein